MSNDWGLNGTETELNRAERETLLHLHEHEMQTTTDILHACDAIGYRRKALRAIDALEDHGLIRTRQDDRDDESPLNPPRLAMLSRSGERFVEEHAAELATADMTRDNLREAVYELESEVEDMETRLQEYQSEVESEIDEVSREGVHALRADVEQLADRVDAVEAAADDHVTADDLDALKRQVESSLAKVRGDLGQQVTDANTRIGDVETEVDALTASVDDLDEWVAETEKWIEGKLIPSVRRVEPVVKWFESRQREDGGREVEDFDAVEGIRRRLFSQ